ncbi:MAG: hypothetical protein AAFN74_21405 [Myxococcota bacterium]
MPTFKPPSARLLRASVSAWQPGTATIASTVTLAACLAPIAQNIAKHPKDDFPLSYYPMFTKPRGATTKIQHAVAVLPSGETVDIPSKFAGPGGMNTQRRQMRKAVRKGRADQLAQKIAAQFGRTRRARRIAATRVDIVESTYDIRRYLDGHLDPVRRTVVATADIPAQAAPSNKASP